MDINYKNLLSKKYPIFWLLFIVIGILVFVTMYFIVTDFGRRAITFVQPPNVETGTVPGSMGNNCLIATKFSVEDLTRDDVFDLRGIATAIKEKDTTLASAFSMAKPNAISKASKQLGDLPIINQSNNIVTDNNAITEIAHVVVEENEEVKDESKKINLGEAIEKRKNNKAN